jgi:hypothetical protein
VMRELLRFRMTQWKNIHSLSPSLTAAKFFLLKAVS